MDQQAFVASVRADLAEELRLGKLAEIIRRAYAEDAERELTPMRPVRGGLTDADLDDPRRGQAAELNRSAR